MLRARPQTLCFVTGNANKLRELVSSLVGRSDVHLESRALDLPELQGKVEEIAIAKAKRASEIVGGFVLVEDTCLQFKALNGLPGPYIKWFLVSSFMFVLFVFVFEIILLLF
jgi:inosine triphosphate pyrophosphatase